ncbi:23S rRNA (uracil(1939)-C(5))-methyltransferase RlmD [Caldanaerobius polysaccharolyticus]|uniref:23S rRNA (uracil(1939)-C(5))-methyltransferase RlmD n=1 Tax=Caldanaerobius polysaccharolyticus TaxID=44256 RepID=UPI00047AD64B|nr:23S rRNA (uracil(1939)-C(5))-methyltransferase RlmD [Caldanaerobius polysaccharolyticus]
METPVSVGKRYIVDIVDLSSEGLGVGKVDGFTIFVRGALIGEKVEAVVLNVKKSYAEGEAINIIAKSYERVKPICPVEGCGGCQLMHLNYGGQLRYKVNKVKNVLSRIGKIDAKVNDIIGAERPLYYRNKAEFAVSWEDDRPIVGFRAPKSHDVVPVDACYIQNAVVMDAVKAVKEFLVEFCNHEIKSVITKISSLNGKVMIILETIGENLSHSEQLISMLKRVECIDGVVLKWKYKKGREKTRILYGTDKLVDKIGDLYFYVTPLSFFQVNPEQTVKLYDKVMEYADLSGNEVVVDAYCGIGTIGLYLARKAKKVYGIEIVEEAIEAAKKNADLNVINNASFIAGKAEEELKRLYNKGIVADVVVVDPPRKGCDSRLLGTLADMRPKRIVYVSCDPGTLARDLRFLADNGFNVVEVQPVDMFPQTYHVETVALLANVKNK